MSIPKPSKRFFVPDLSPMDRPELSSVKGWRAVFVAESPHIHEITPEVLTQRRPLCGAAGKVWWGKLSEILEGKRSEDLSLEHLLAFTRKHKIVVLNAVRYPLDPKIAAHDPAADPSQNLGFAKATGEFSYKKLRRSPQVAGFLKSLRERLDDPMIAGLPIYPLGNDAEWFITEALGKEEAAARIQGKIPHPSAWWRKGGHFGRVAQEKLAATFA